MSDKPREIEKYREGLVCLVPKDGSQHMITCHEKTLCDCQVLEIFEAFDQLREENERLINDKTQLNLRWEESSKAALEVGENYRKLKALCDEMVGVLESTPSACMNTGYYGQLNISPGQCSCSSCNKKKVLTKYREMKGEKNGA